MDLLSIAANANRFASIKWTGVTTWSASIPRSARNVLLHAGPPLKAELPHAILNSACVALVYEGQAQDMAQARSLLTSGKIVLEPAQDHGVVTPLAQVVSASMPLAEVDNEQTKTRRYAPLIEAGVPALRFGSPSQDAAARIRMMDRFARTALYPLLLERPVHLANMVHAGLAAQEECHALTGAANAALVTDLDLPLQDRLVISGYQAFALPILMAACSVWLEDSGGEIVAAGGNGVEFGYKERGQSVWRTIEASPPQGALFGSAALTDVLGAIGDSAVVDFAGLGGQALQFCPSLQEAWARYLPGDLAAHRLAVLDPSTGNVSTSSIVRNAHSPLVNLAMLGRGEAAGLIGRGVYKVPAKLFEKR